MAKSEPLSEEGGGPGAGGFGDLGLNPLVAAFAAGTPRSSMAVDLTGASTPPASMPAPGTPPADVNDPAEAGKILLGNVADLLKEHGSPCSYLSQVLAHPHDGKFFLEWLWVTFPECDDVLYTYDAKLPMVESEQDMGETLPLRVHVSCLGFDASCSLKPACGMDIAKELAGLYIQNGFISGSSPLVLAQPEGASGCCPYALARPWDKNDGHPTLTPFSLGYLKGFARASTLLMVLHRSMVLKLDLKNILPAFHESVCKISVHCFKQNSRVDEALMNMKMSASGSIRKAVNLIQCVYMLTNLMRVAGLHDTGTFIKRWNNMTTKSFQIAGRKSMSLKQLFDVTPKDRQLAVLKNLAAILRVVFSEISDSCLKSFGKENFLFH